MVKELLVVIAIIVVIEVVAVILNWGISALVRFVTIPDNGRSRLVYGTMYILLSSFMFYVALLNTSPVTKMGTFIMVK